MASTVKKQMGNNPTTPKHHKDMLELYEHFMDAMQAALRQDPVSDSVLKIAAEFFKSQKFDYGEASTIVNGEDKSYDVEAITKAVPFSIAK